MSEIDYVDFMFGVGAPSGAYGRSGDTPLIYWRLDAPTVDEVLHLSVDAGATWQAQGGGGGGTSDHAQLTNRAWTSSGHTGTASRLAGFDGSGAATTYQIGAAGGVQAWDADLDGYAALSTTGLVARTGSGTAAARTITAGSAQLTVTNGNGVGGNPTIDIAYASSLRESGGTTLPVGAVADGQVLKRVGSSVVGTYLAVAVSVSSGLIEISEPGVALPPSSVSSGTVA